MQTSRVPLLIAIFAMLLSADFVRAQAFIEHITPPVIERGKKARVVFVGRQLAGAHDVWNSLPQGALKAKPVESAANRAVFDIEAASDAPVGICGVRVATRDGMSNAHLFLIDDLPVRERNADVSMKLTLPAAVWSSFPEAAVHRYQIEVKAGKSVSFEVVGSRFGKDADPLLTIRDARGQWVAERDNDPGLYYDCRFEHRFAAPGTFTIELRDSRFRGSENFPYVLRMGRFPAARVAMPSAVKTGRNDLCLPELSSETTPFDFASRRLPGLFVANFRRADDDGSTWLPLMQTDFDVTLAREFDPKREQAFAAATSPSMILAFNLSPLHVNPLRSLDAMLHAGRAQATCARVPGVFCGVLRRPGERNTFMFELAKGQSIYVRGEAQSLNSPVDLDMVLTNHLGREVRRGAENRGETTLDFTSGSPGTYGLMVRDLLHDGGNAFTYQLTVSDKPFPPAFLAEVEGVTVPQGSYQPIPISFVRNAIAGPIKLNLLGAPAGMKLVPDEIGEKETSIVCKLEAAANVPVGIHTLQILAETASGPTLVKTQPLIDRQVINVDLIPLALREDQRRLPPSLADRIAVQVVPQAPFTAELPEPEILLPRYQRADIPIATTRRPGFDGPISFTARGGQLADKNEGRTRVYAEFPEATAKRLNVAGSIHSKILSNIGKSRIEVTAAATHQGRRVSLTRTFELNLSTAFNLTAAPAKISLLPGESAKVRLLANRVRSFDGEVTLKLSPIQGLSFPETLVIPKGQPGVDMNVLAEADCTPRRQNLQVHGVAVVDGFEEEQLPGIAGHRSPQGRAAKEEMKC